MKREAVEPDNTDLLDHRGNTAITGAERGTMIGVFLVIVIVAAI
ncbi:MAG: hypothetical protein WCO63_05530 [Bacteroidota bacterium]